MLIISITYRRPDLGELQKATIAEYYPEAKHLMAVTCNGYVTGDFYIPCHDNERENKIPKAYFNALEYVLDKFPEDDIMVLEADMIPLKRVPEEYLKEGFCQGSGSGYYWPGVIMIPKDKRYLKGNLTPKRSEDMKILKEIYTTRNVYHMDYIGDIDEYFLHWNCGSNSQSKNERLTERLRLWNLYKSKYNLKSEYLTKRMVDPNRFKSNEELERRKTICENCSLLNNKNKCSFIKRKYGCGCGIPWEVQCYSCDKWTI